MTDLAAELEGGLPSPPKVVPGDVQEIATEPVDEIDPEGFAELEALSRLAASQGIISRRLPDVVRRVQGALGDLEFDELQQLAFDMNVSLPECCQAAEHSRSDPEVYNRSCDEVASLLILHSIYGEGYFGLSADRLEDVADIIRDTVRKGKGFMTHQKAGETGDQYRDRLCVGIAPYMLEAIKERRPVSLNGDEVSDGNKKDEDEEGFLL